MRSVDPCWLAIYTLSWAVLAAGIKKEEGRSPEYRMLFSGALVAKAAFDVVQVAGFSNS